MGEKGEGRLTYRCVWLVDGMRVADMSILNKSIRMVLLLINQWSKRHSRPHSAQLFFELDGQEQMSISSSKGRFHS